MVFKIIRLQDLGVEKKLSSLNLSPKHTNAHTHSLRNHLVGEPLEFNPPDFVKQGIEGR